MKKPAATNVTSTLVMLVHQSLIIWSWNFAEPSLKGIWSTRKISSKSEIVKWGPLVHLTWNDWVHLNRIAVIISPCPFWNTNLQTAVWCSAADTILICRLQCGVRLPLQYYSADCCVVFGCRCTPKQLNRVISNSRPFYIVMMIIIIKIIIIIILII